MTLSVEKGLALVKQTIKTDLRHRDYDRVTSLAKRYTRYVTGEDIEELLIQFVPREDTDLFKQRARLTHLNTADIANRLATPMYKVGRTIANENIYWKSKEKAEEKMANLLEAINNFHGDESVDAYLTEALPDIDCTDPNSFIIVEFAGEVNPNDPTSIAKPYPFVVNSEEAINYKYVNNALQFILVLTEAPLKRYTIYLKDEAYVFQQILKDNVDAFRAANPAIEIFRKDDIEENTEYYSIELVQHKAGRIPAIRVGTKRDKKTRGRTCVPMIHPAKCYFEKAIKTVSEFDLTNALHTFQQKIQYDQVCTGDVGNNIICKDGRTLEGEACGVCKGSGFNTHTSSADIIRFKMPKDPKDMMNLDNLMVYKGPKMDLLEFQKKLGLYELPELALRAVYTSELFSTDTISTTATEKNIDMESVYDTLKPFADNWSKVSKHIKIVIAAYRSVGTDIVIEHKFPKDFKMKPLSVLLDDFQKANTSGASSYVKREINRDIAHKLYVDKPEELLKIDVKDKYFPFVGKSESEINNIMTNDLCTRFNKILYANFEQIFSELEQENTKDNVNFYHIEPTKQKQLLSDKVKAYMLAIEEEAAASRATSIGGFGDGAAGAAETQDYTAGDTVDFNGQPVEILTANPGPDGGKYSIKLPDGTTQNVSGKDLQ